MTPLVNPRGYAARFLARGDLILAVNGRAVTNPEQLENIPRGAQITLQRRGQQATLLVR